MKLTDFKALTFDCYGTLIDWETGILSGLQPLVEKADIEPSRDQILEIFAQNESAQEVETPATPYSQLLSIVYKRIARTWGVAVTNEEANSFGASIPDWPEFSDSVSALQYLKKHYKLVILSNVDNESFSFSNQKLGVSFDAIYTAEDVGSYKPAPANFKYMLDKLKSIGVARSEVLHTAESMFHDHKPANEIGLASCWIYRRHNDQGFGATMNPGAMPKYDFRFTSMAELAKAHQEQLRA